MRRQDNPLYQRALKFLYQRTNYETFRSIPYDQMKRSMRILKEFIAFIGEPDRYFTVVCVAGTKGKGTVCAALDRIYRESGYRVGLFTSPHLDDLVERIQIDGANCDKTLFSETLLNLIERWKEFVARQKSAEKSDDGLEFSDGAGLDSERLTFFEWMFVLALVIFARSRVDVAIVEVGMGGRFDATNAINADVSVLTSVSFDHCEQLGDSLTSIAAEKLGIVKTNAPLVCGVGFSNFLYGNELLEAREKIAAEREERRRQEELEEQEPNLAKAPKVSVWKDAEARGEEEVERLARERCALSVDPQTTIAPADVVALIEQARARAREFDAPFYQVEGLSPLVEALPSPPFDSVRRWNFEIALAVADVLAKRETFPSGRRPDDVSEQKRRLRYPVSKEAILRAATNFSIPARMEVVSTSPLTIVDGAHNRASVAAFMSGLKERYPDKRIRILFAPSYGKDVRGMIAEMIPRADEIILTERIKEKRATPLPDLIETTEELLDEICEEDAPIRRKIRVVPDFRAFLADYCSHQTSKTEVMCAVGSFYLAAEVRKIAKQR